MAIGYNADPATGRLPERTRHGATPVQVRVTFRVFPHWKVAGITARRQNSDGWTSVAAASGVK